MDWIDINVELPPEREAVLTTNHAYLDPANERYYVIAERRGEDFCDPETNESIFKPDYWCKITPPSC